jgi:LysR family transcriptional regulator for metE and metH
LTEAILELVKARMGVSVMANWAVAPHVRLGQLAAVRITARGMRRRWSAAVRSDTTSPPWLMDFIASLTWDAFRGVTSPPLLRSA